jgi:hypothetical protein
MVRKTAAKKNHRRASARRRQPKRQTDIGRSISDITTLMKGMHIHAYATQVLEKLERKKLEIQDKKGRWCEMRLLPYRTIDNVIAGMTIRMNVTSLVNDQLRPVKMATFERPVVPRQTGS